MSKLGPQFNIEHSKVEMVPISLLNTMRGNELWKGEDHVNELAESIKKDGMHDPGIIQYYQQSRTAYLGEGNHRLAALDRSGYTHMPVRVVRLNMADEANRGQPVRGVEPDRHGYVPGDMKPSDIMDFD
jgi:ParB-like chromosome segregation protein Spo0J